MEKCHCSGIRFEKVVELCKSKRCDYKEAAKELDVSETCTACKEDMEKFCESELGLVAG